jgi:hypothetical protein
MKIIRKSEQKIIKRSSENREVRIIFDESVQSYDWLEVTHSQKQSDNPAYVNINMHSHPNARELILFQKQGTLNIKDKKYHFIPGDALILESDEIHGAYGLSKHGCICILLGKGKPQKLIFEK